MIGPGLEPPYNAVDAKRFDVDGKRYVLNSSFRPHGLFDNKYYTLYLKPDS